jgi:hypothetical protein
MSLSSESLAKDAPSVDHSSVNVSLRSLNRPLRPSLRRAAHTAAGRVSAATADAAREWYGLQVRADAFPRRFWVGTYVCLSLALFFEAAVRHWNSGKGLTYWYPAAKVRARAFAPSPLCALSPLRASRL